MHWLLLGVGLVVGLVMSESAGGAVIGALVGYAIGLAAALRKLGQDHAGVMKRLAAIGKEVDELQRRLAAVEGRDVGDAASGSPASEAARAVVPPAAPVPDYRPPRVVPSPAMSTSPEHEQVLRGAAPQPALVLPAAARVAEADHATAATVGGTAAMPTGAEASPVPTDAVEPAIAATADVPAAPPAPRGPSIIERGIAGARAWLFGGNTVLRVGLVLLFLGLAFLLRYATEGMTFPVELRYAAVGAAAVALIATGWLLRHRNENYALLMQGGGVAVMYLTTFAAMRLHPLLSGGMAFTLLVAVTVFSAMLAVLQNALGLAATAALGGFAAPILTSTGAGSHVALFSYFALLNAGIFAIAWYKAWRLLNLIGFVGTFGIGFAWGLRAYTPALFASTEPFLLLFFLMYVGIGLLFARRRLRDAGTAPDGRDALLRWAVGKGDYVDGTLLFGVPIVAFGLQFALVRHLAFGPAFSALAVGLFYMVLARLVASRSPARAVLLVETCLALGVIFGTLAIPLGLDARWTSAAWAVEGAGIYWLGLRQGRSVARGFALLLQVGAALVFLAGLRPGGDGTVLAGVPLGAAMIGAAMLASFWHLRQHRGAALRAWEPACRPALAATGLFFVYLIAPLVLGVDATAVAWALGGLATVFVGLRLGERAFLFSAFAVQLAAGALFAGFLRGDDLGGGGVGWRGLLTASLIGLSLVGGMILAARDDRVNRDPALMRGLAVVLLVGLVFLNLAVLFVLPWQRASAVWAGSGLLILWLSLHLQQRASFVFGLLLQVVGGLSFLGVALLAGTRVDEDGARPLMHAGFWTPLALGVAGLVGAWRLQRGAGDKATAGAASTVFGSRALLALSQVLMVWGAAWWVLSLAGETLRIVPVDVRAHAVLIVAAATVALWAVVARRAQWAGLASLSTLLAPVAALILAIRWEGDYHPAADLGWVAWPAVFAAHGLLLHRAGVLLRAPIAAAAHVLGCWLLITVLSLELRYALMLLSDGYNAWRWLGWALLPSLYLVAMSLPRAWPWPVSAAPTAYRLWAPLPMAAMLLVWFWTANIFSDGAADPLPYLPLLNPLELGMAFALLGCHLWATWAMPRLGAGDLVQRWAPQAVVGASLFALFTATVFRTAHHWGGVPYELGPMLSSMFVQAGLSIVWTLLALAMMIVGHLRARREMWLIGAVLIGVVVAKLFFVELSNQGGLARIVSFIGVGVLLLVVGYFAPLPPRRPADAASTAERMP